MSSEACPEVPEPEVPEPEPTPAPEAPAEPPPQEEEEAGEEAAEGATATIEPKQSLGEFASSAGLRPAAQAAMQAWIKQRWRRPVGHATPQEWQAMYQEMLAHIPR